VTDAAPPVWNIANAVTAARVVLVPIFGIVLVADGGGHQTLRLAAFGIFALAALSDRLDGYLARSQHLVTDVGKIADPIADKLLMGTALVALSVMRELPWWVTVVILVREIGITVLRLSMLHRRVIAASTGGKLKTVVQAVAIGLFILPLHEWTALRFVAWGVMWLAIVLTMVTGFDYLRRAAAIQSTPAEVQ
jgi:CDP-diacylglycerol--glycerol-3-phosphate 3-phosphatidyltransferase